MQEKPLYSKENLIACLKAYAKETGKSTITQSAFGKWGKGAGVQTYVNVFGSWETAVRAAGFSPGRPSRFTEATNEPDYTKQEVIAVLRQCAKETGTKQLTQSIYTDWGKGPSLYAIGKLFSTWGEATIAAGLPSNGIQTPRYTKEQLIGFLRQFVEETGGTAISIRAYNEWGKGPTPPTYIRQFGSWKEAVQAAELELKSKKKNQFSFSKDYMLTTLRHYVDLHGEQLSTVAYNQAKKDGEPSAGSFVDAFGSWSKALEAIGIASTRSLSDERMLDILREAHSGRDTFLTQDEFRAKVNSPAPRAYFDRFGSWASALDATNLNLKQASRHSRRWSDQEMLDALRSAHAGRDTFLTQQEFNELADTPSIVSYKARFGSWKAALETAGLYLKRQKRHS